MLNTIHRQHPTTLKTKVALDAITPSVRTKALITERLMKCILPLINKNKKSGLPARPGTARTDRYARLKVFLIYPHYCLDNGVPTKTYELSTMV